MNIKHLQIALDIVVILMIIASWIYFSHKDKTFELITHDACRLCEEKTNVTCAVLFGNPNSEDSCSCNYPEINLSSFELAIS